MLYNWHPLLSNFRIFPDSSSGYCSDRNSYHILSGYYASGTVSRVLYVLPHLMLITTLQSMLI